MEGEKERKEGDLLTFCRLPKRWNRSIKLEHRDNEPVDLIVVPQEYKWVFVHVTEVVNARSDKACFSSTEGDKIRMENRVLDAPVVPVLLQKFVAEKELKNISYFETLGIHSSMTKGKEPNVLQN